jgi:hypothetical protein
MTTEQEQKLSFACTCNGCRNYPKDLNRLYWEGLVAELNGFYFSPTNRKFHRSRITDWTFFGESKAVSIKETRAKGWDVSDGREYAVSLWCKFGNLVDSIAQENGKKATSFMVSEEASLKIKACACHGCQLDRAGR